MMRDENPEYLAIRVERLEDAHGRMSEAVADLFEKLLRAEDQCRNLLERIAANENEQAGERFTIKTALGLLTAEIGKPGLGDIFQSYVDATGSMVENVEIFKAASQLADEIVEESRDWSLQDLNKAA